MLGIEDHGIPTFFLYLDYGGASQGFGGFTLSSVDQIIELLKIVGVEKWEDLKGKHVRVKSQHGNILALGHFLKDHWYQV